MIAEEPFFVQTFFLFTQDFAVIFVSAVVSLQVESPDNKWATSVFPDAAIVKESFT